MSLEPPVHKERLLEFIDSSSEAYRAIRLTGGEWAKTSGRRIGYAEPTSFAGPIARASMKAKEFEILLRRR
jgi:hypothetical protein